MRLHIAIPLLAALAAIAVTQPVENALPLPSSSSSSVAVPAPTQTAQASQAPQQFLPTPFPSVSASARPALAFASPPARTPSPSRAAAAAPQPPSGSVDAFTTLSSMAQHSIFVHFIQSSNLTDVFSTSRDISVFAPTDAGFLTTLRDFRYKRAGDTATVQQFWTLLLENKPANLNVTRMILYHVLGKRMTKENIESKRFRSADKYLMTRSGDEVEVDIGSLRDQAKSVPNPNFTSPFNILASNGIIHPMDRVLFPIHVDRPALTKIVGDISNTLESGGAPICFPLSATVRTADGGTHSMQTLSAGDSIQVSEHGAMSSVYLFSHRVHDGLYDFIRLSTSGGHSITLSASHYVYAGGKLTAAGAVRVDDVLRTVDGPARVTDVETVRERGLVAPHTLHGDLVVDGVVASGYTTAVHPRVAHWLLAPVRAVVRMGMAKEPLGTMLYEGHHRLARFLPSGAERY